MSRFGRKLERLLRFGLATLALALLPGCQNVCQRASTHIANCVSEICPESANNPWCSDEQRAATVARVDSAEVLECAPDIHHGAQRTLMTPCETLLATPPVIAAEEP